MPMLNIGSLGLQLERKAIKNLHISVVPPDGKVRVSAPARMSDTAIRMAVISRLPWIRKQQQSFANQPRQTERQFVSGETHYFWGRRYRLEVVERVGKHEVILKSNSRLRLCVSPGTSVLNKSMLLNDWYRAQLKAAVPALLTRWQPRLRVEPVNWSVKIMKTKWGSCNTDAGRIWVNLELAKKPPECLEYILVHELVHLLERHHNDRFMAYMDKCLPNWRERRDLLNKLPLAHCSWEY